jgi:hypothetical protein
MGVRERVQEAVNASTSRAEKLLAEAPDADEHARLTILVNGWFQGIAAALEEIAVELDMRASSQGEPTAVPASRPPVTGESSAATEEEEADEREDAADSDESALLERAHESLEETRALRAERDE